VVWDFYADRMATIDENLADLPDEQKPSVLVLSYNVKGEEAALEVPPVSWIQTQMVDLTGGQPVWTSAGQGGWTVVNLEQIAAWNPDKIFIISYFEDVDTVVETLTADPNWENLTAVQEDQVFGFPKDFYSWDQPDTRWILGLTWMATRMHPDRFAEMDVVAEVYAFYQELYRLNAGTVDEAVLPLLEGDLAAE
jgi:iron complex transport system substrate-binding protein